MKRKLSILVFTLFCLSFASALDVENALKQTSKQFSASIKTNSVVAIIGVYSDSTEFSEFMYDELTANFVKARALTIVDRANLEAIKKEMSFQLSGEVGDESIQELGAKLGAQTVIKGDLKFYGGSRYRLVIRALNVKTAAVEDIYSEIVEPNKIELSWLTQAPTSSKKPSLEPKFSAVSLGFQNFLLFGLGSYRAGHYLDGALLTTGYVLAEIFMPLGGVLLGSDDGVGAAIAFLTIGSLLEATCIIYGSVVPYYYEETQTIAKVFNPKEDGFHIAFAPAIEKDKKGINFSPAVTLSYRFNY